MRVGVVLVVAGLPLGATGCGGSDAERQDASEPDAEFPVEVTSAKFPQRQRLAQTSDLQLAITNVGEETIPDLAVTIHVGDQPADGPFSIRSEQPGLANPNRPVWILENDYPKLLEAGVTPGELDRLPSAGAEAAQANTFSFGEVPPGETKEIVWRVTPVVAGTFTVHYRIAAGLQGRARAVTPDGGPVEGQFVATITDRPPQTCVNDAGEVVRGNCQL